MLSPRSFLVSRQSQKQTSSISPSSATSSTATLALSPPLSPTASTTSSIWRKDDSDSTKIPRSDFNSQPVTTHNMAVNTRPRSSVIAAHDSLPSPPRSPSPSPSNDTRSTTPTSPVRIPTKCKTNTAHSKQHRNHRHYEERRQRSSSPRWTNNYSPDAIPPSVAALLAVTAIPPQRRSTRQRSTTKEQERPMTVKSILQGHESEKELSLKFSKGPLDVLLSPPEDLEDVDDLSVGESTIASSMSTRTVSCESVPSLSDSFSTETFSSVESPQSAPRGRRLRPMRSPLTPVSSPPGEHEEHPLGGRDPDVDDLNFNVFDSSPENEEKKGGSAMFRPFRSAFKSNLTASLRALRNAARSFSNMNMPSIPPEDFLTRSILTMEPNVPFTDERMPPTTLDEEPSAAVRRYLNPTQTARLEPRATSTNAPAQSFTASIQMQTYKVHRSKSPAPGGRISRGYGDQSARGKEAVLSFPLGPRQREMRENPDFIRVAVMEMAMRKSGKLDEQRPGRARWALPPRKTSTKAYEIGPDGVPARWIPVTVEIATHDG